MRVDAPIDLAVEFEHQTQHAVRCRMLRPEVDGEVAKLVGHRSALRFLVAGQRIVRALPRREEIEIAKLLCEPDLVVDHALGLVVLAHLDEAGEREILAQRMTFEAVVG